MARAGKYGQIWLKSHPDTWLVNENEPVQVILGLGWTYQCDIWSAGCIIVELITGRALFQTHENLEHLAMMERVLEKVPADMSRHASGDARKYFSKDDTLLWGSSANRKSVKAVQQLTSLRRLLRCEADTSATPHLESLYSLLKQMLCFRPGERSSARHCLDHDFFRENIRSLLPRKDEPSEQRTSGSKEQEVGDVQRLSHASRATSESCPVACIPKGGHKRNGSTAGEGTNSVKRRPVVVVEQDGKEDLDVPAESDSARHHPQPLPVRHDASACDQGAALDSDTGPDAAVRMELRPDAVHSGADMLAAAAQHGAKLRGSDTVPSAPSLKSSGSFWHDATVSQDSGAPRDEAIKQEVRQDNGVKVSCIGTSAAVDDDTRTSDLAENVSWPGVRF